MNETAAVSLAEGLKTDLKRRDFGKIYDESSDFLRDNVSREDFIRRTGLLMDAVQKIDPEINWHEDNSLGASFRVRNYEENSMISVYRRIGSDQQGIHILMYWNLKDGKAKLNDLTAISGNEQFETVGELVESK